MVWRFNQKRMAREGLDIKLGKAEEAKRLGQGFLVILVLPNISVGKKNI